MADKKISALTASTTPLGGTEVLPIVQGGSTVKVSVANLTAGRDTSVKDLNASGNVVSKGTAIFFGDGLDNSAYVYATGGPVHIFANAAATFDFTTAGNLKPLTAGKGIDFSANTHAAGMTSELLSWYEEGAWTPTGNNITFASASGKYTRIGRQVIVTFDVTLPSTANADQCQLKGLPFTVGSGGGASIGYTTNSNVVTFLAGDTGTSLNGYLFGGSALANVTYSGARVVGSCTYFV